MTKNTASDGWEKGQIWRKFRWIGQWGEISCQIWSPGVNFTNILWAAFSYESFLRLQFGFVFFGERILVQKLLLKCWWNWHQVAAWVPDKFWNFYLLKSHKIANNSATTEARENISTDLEQKNFRNFLICVWLNLKTIKF